MCFQNNKEDCGSLFLALRTLSLNRSSRDRVYLKVFGPESRPIKVSAVILKDSISESLFVAYKNFMVALLTSSHNGQLLAAPLVQGHRELEWHFDQKTLAQKEDLVSRADSD